MLRDFECLFFFFSRGSSINLSLLALGILLWTLFELLVVLIKRYWFLTPVDK